MPSERVGSANDQTPLADALDVTTEPPSITISTVLPASALPLAVGVVELVSPSVTLVPVSGLMPDVRGASGAVRSMVKASVAEREDRLPARSVARAWAVKAPSAKGVASTRVKAPLASAVAVPTLIPFTSNSTELPTSAVPRRPMAPVLVIRVERAAPLASVRPKTLGAATVVSISTGLLAESMPVLPAMSVALALNW